MTPPPGAIVVVTVALISIPLGKFTWRLMWREGNKVIIDNIEMDLPPEPDQSAPHEPLDSDDISGV